MLTIPRPSSWDIHWSEVEFHMASLRLLGDKKEEYVLVSPINYKPKMHHMVTPGVATQTGKELSKGKKQRC